MRRITTAFVLGLALMLWASAVQAKLRWYVAEVLAVGPADTGAGYSVYMRLNDTANVPAFNQLWFQASDNVKKEMLATVLTAIATDKRIWIKVDLDALVPIVLRIYIRK